MLMRIGSPVHCEFVSTTSVGLAWSCAALARMATWPLRSSVTGELSSSSHGSRGRVSARNRMSSFDSWQRALAVSGLGTISRHVGIACRRVDPQIDRPAAGADGHPVAALVRRPQACPAATPASEDLAAGHQHGILPRERETRLDQQLASVRGVDRAIRGKAGGSRSRIARLRER